MCSSDLQQVQQYHDRLSGPLRDRIDLTVELAPVPFDTLAAPRSGDTSADVRARVQSARDRQLGRAALVGQDLNARLSAAAVDCVAALDRTGARCLKEAAARTSLSARGVHRVLRVARTIADLDGSDAVLAPHVAEAVQYRPAPHPAD